MPMKSDSRCFLFSGTSMLPTLRTGDRVYARKIPWNELKVGDLVAAAPDRFSRPVIHRLVAWQASATGRLGVLKGDGLPHTDNFLLCKENYLGRVRARERGGKKMVFSGLQARTRARVRVFLSVRNLTARSFRSKVKNGLAKVIQKTPGVEILQRLLLRKSTFYCFNGPGALKRLHVTCLGRPVGEITFRKDPFGVQKSVSFSAFSLVVSSDRLAAHAAGRFPALFDR